MTAVAVAASKPASFGTFSLTGARKQRAYSRVENRSGQAPVRANGNSKGSPFFALAAAPCYRLNGEGARRAHPRSVSSVIT